MVSKDFLIAWARDRGIKTFIQVFLVVLVLAALPEGASIVQLTPTEALALPWATALTSASLTTLVSLGMAIADPDFVIGAPADTATDERIAELQAAVDEAVSTSYGALATAAEAGAKADAARAVAASR